MKTNTKRIALALALIMIMFTFAACGGNSSSAPEATPGTDGTLDADSTDKLYVYVCGQYVSDDGLDALKSTIESVVGDGVTVEYTTVSTGDDSDPSMQMAGLMKLTTAIAAQEVDLVIADETNGARNARGDSFYALSDILTEDEITALGDRALKFDILDDESNPTGETTDVCGIDLTGEEMITSCMGSVNAGAYVVGNAPNFENAKLVLKALAAQEATTNAE